MTQEALDKIKQGIKDSNISIHVFNLIMTLVLSEEERNKKPNKLFMTNHEKKMSKKQEQKHN